MIKATKTFLQQELGCSRKTAVLTHRIFGNEFETIQDVKIAVGKIDEARQKPGGIQKLRQ